jgi:drug/metabolite transporter (DMT)-like permease
MDIMQQLRVNRALWDNAPMHFGPGELLSLLSAAAWAVGVILYRRLVQHLPPLTLGFLKSLIVLAMMLPLALVLHGPRLPDIGFSDAMIAIASGALGIAVADTLYFVALRKLGAGAMGVIGNTYSPFVLALAALFLGERLGPSQIAGFVLVMIGVGVIAGHKPAPAEPESPGVDIPPSAPEAAAIPASRGNLPFVLTGILSIALMAAAIVMVKPVLEVRPLGWVTLLRLVGAVLGLLAISAARGELRTLWPRNARIDWKLLLPAAFVGQCLSMLFWLGGYALTSASIAAVLNETASIFILLLAWFFLREPIGRRGALGIALTLPGVILMLRG